MLKSLILREGVAHETDSLERANASKAQEHHSLLRKVAAAAALIFDVWQLRKSSSSAGMAILELPISRQSGPFWIFFCFPSKVEDELRSGRCWPCLPSGSLSAARFLQRSGFSFSFVCL